MDSLPPGPQPVARARALAVVFHPRVCLALLILATFIARQDVLSTPSSRVRSTLTAMVTRNLSRDLDELGIRALFYPRIDSAGDQPGYLLQEFPLVNLAGVVLEKAFDLERETAYRLPSLLLFAVMLVLLYGFVRARFGTPEALASILLVSYFPLAVYQSLEVMPEQGVATAFMGGLYLFDRHLERDRIRWLVASTVCFSLMLLIKSTSGLLLLAPLGLYWARRGTLRGLFGPRYLVACTAGALPLLLWLFHAWGVNLTSRVDDGRSMSLLIENYLDQHERWEQLSAAKTYTGVWNMLVLAFTRWPLFLFVGGFVASLLGRGGSRALLTCWLASLVLFFIVLPFNLSTHWYYTHGYAPLFAVGASIALGGLVRSATRRVPEVGRPVVGAVLATAGLAFVLHSNWTYVPPTDRAKHQFGLAVQSVMQPRALGIISSEEKGVWDGELFYASDTRGWRASTRQGLSRRPISPEFIADKRQLGAEFLAHFGAPEKLAERIPELYQDLIAANAVLTRSPNWIVFALQDPSR